MDFVFAKNRQVRKVSFLTGALACAMLAACGTPENKNLPKDPGELGPNDYAPGQSTGAGEQKWDAFAEYMGLTMDLTKAPTAADPASPANTEIREGIQTAVGGTAIKTQCAAIVSLDEIPGGTKKLKAGSTTGETESTKVPGKVYKLKYKLASAPAQAETITRSAIVTVPVMGVNNLPNTRPLALYTHGGDNGLAYSEMISAVGDLQSTHVFAAPTYPGEPLCAVDGCGPDKTPLEAAVGEESPFFGDVTETLGLHSCVNKLVNVAKPDGLANATANNPLFGKVSMHPDPGDNKKRPKTIIIGASRGGRVAHLAAAHTGIFHTAQASGAIPGALTFPYISAIGTLFPSTTNLVGQSRLIFESIVKGRVDQTTFARAPAVRGSKLFINTYIESTEADATKKFAVDVAKRDLVFMGPYMAAGLMNWQQRFSGNQNLAQLKGALTVLHGLEDRVVPYSESFIAYNIFKTVNSLTFGTSNQNSPLKTAPGFKYHVMGFQPQEPFYSAAACNEADKAAGKPKCFIVDASKRQLNHGDASFGTGTLANTNTTLIPPNSALNGTAQAIATQLVPQQQVQQVTPIVNVLMQFYSPDTRPFYGANEAGTGLKPVLYQAPDKLLPATPALSAGVWRAVVVTPLIAE